MENHPHKINHGNVKFNKNITPKMAISGGLGKLLPRSSTTVYMLVEDKNI
jgi:hypothetical protein